MRSPTSLQRSLAEVKIGIGPKSIRWSLDFGKTWTDHWLGFKTSGEDVRETAYGYRFSFSNGEIIDAYWWHGPKMFEFVRMTPWWVKIRNLFRK